MTLYLYTGNRMERLVDRLADLLRETLCPVFTPEKIVVQSRGMQRWISMELARRFGVWANCDYPFPNRMAAELFRLAVPPPMEGRFRDVMSWRIMRLLPELCDFDEFRQLRRYLRGGNRELKLQQLSTKIADTFDQYTLFRPELVLGWEAGKRASGEDAWQSMLWTRLVADSDGMRLHRARLRLLFFQWIDRIQEPPDKLPRRVVLFGISYLPLFHLELFAALARVSEVHFFLLSPTSEYWGDIISHKAAVRLPEPERLLRTEGNPLLASLGRNGRDFSELLIDLDGTEIAETELYERPVGDNLLAALQADMLSLSGWEGQVPARTLGSGDRSVMIHSCHGPLREIEVLYDNLLDLFQNVPDLEPRDVLVMTPDITRYAPYIEAVFDSGALEHEGMRIPYSIADRVLAEEGEIAPAMLRLLGLYRSRLTAPEVFGLLASPPVCRKSGLSPGDLDIVREWIFKTRIRWGIDETDRFRAGLPLYRENSWRAGLDRLLLGYSMPETAGIFNGVLPFDTFDSSVVATLGALCEFIDRLEVFVRSLDTERTPGQWRIFFSEALATFMAPSEQSEQEFARVSEAVHRFAGTAADAGFDKPISAEVAIAVLNQSLHEEQQGFGFMTGGVTFAAMLPMRSIPFRVVAMVGMNDGVFPRSIRPQGFDLIARSPRKGDRSRRNDDRYLFLESVLSARDVLYISYTGQSLRDNSEIPPSVVVSELIDTINRSFRTDSGIPAGDRLVVRHAVQSFSPAYFRGDERLFSYSETNRKAIAQALRADAGFSRPFLDRPLDEPSDEWRVVPLDRLHRFFRNPSAFFLEHRLGIRFPERETLLENREPFGIGGLEAYHMKNRLVELLNETRDSDAMLAEFRQRGALPPAFHGTLVFERTLDETRRFIERVAKKAGKPELFSGVPPLEVAVEFGPFRLLGRLNGVREGFMVSWRCAKLTEKDRFGSWIDHLVLNAVAPSGIRYGSVLVTLDRSISYRPVDDAGKLLRQLLERYWQGLCEPLRFFPRASVAYARKRKREDAVNVWRGSEFGGVPGEGSDPAIRRCFPGEEPFDEMFSTIATELVDPMFAHAEEKGESS